MERLLDLPLRREVEEVGEHEEAPRPRRLQVLGGQSEDRQCDRHDAERVDEVEELRATDPDPVEGHEEQVADVGVVPEDVHAAHRHEPPPVGQLPNALVVHAEVVVEGPEVIVTEPDETLEDHEVHNAHDECDVAGQAIAKRRVRMPPDPQAAGQVAELAEPVVDDAAGLPPRSEHRSEARGHRVDDRGADLARRGGRLGKRRVQDQRTERGA